MATIDEAMADMICTAITLGYITKENPKINIQYTLGDTQNKDAQEVDNHKKVADLFNAFDVTLTPTPTASQEEMSYIVGKAGAASSPTTAKAYMDEYWKYLQDVTTEVNKLQELPRGAYIGGVSKLGKLIIVGPSALELYYPTYRDPDDSKIKTAYENAIKHTNLAIKCLNPQKVSIKDYKSYKVDFQCLNKEIEVKGEMRKFKGNQLFKSYHGLIQALITFENYILPNKTEFCFELALGKGTSKVSSCMPCSMFMTSLGMPPTSTHLGRGDNWNIPGVENNKLVSDSKTKQWYSNVVAYFEVGLGKISTSKSKSVQPLWTKVSEIDKGIIPLVFLEALTFEKAFTERIIQTLGRP